MIKMTAMKGIIAIILAIMNYTIVLEKLKSLRYLSTATQEKRVRNAKDFCSRSILLAHSAYIKIAVNMSLKNSIPFQKLRPCPPEMIYMAS